MFSMSLQEQLSRNLGCDLTVYTVKSAHLLLTLFSVFLILSAVSGDKKYDPRIADERLGPRRAG